MDIGGTSIVVGVVDRAGALLRRTRVPTPARQGPDAVLATVATAIRDLADPATLAGVGVGTAGVVDPHTGAVLSATRSIADWAGTPVRATLGQDLGLPVRVANDVHAHALGEGWLGAARGVDSALCVAVGTGVGAGVLLHGDLHRGTNGAAGHIGHVPAPDAAGRRCPCGGRGHVEAVASGPALSAEYQRRAGTGPVDLPAVVEAARSGDRVAQEVLRDGAAALGGGLGGLVNVLAPAVVVVGGGVAASGPAWWDALRRAFAAELIPALAEVPLVSSALGTDAALYGAAQLVWRTGE